MTAPRTTSVVQRLEQILGIANVTGDPTALAACEVDGARPAAVVRPGSAEEICGVVRFAAAEKLAVIPMAGRTKLRMGMPPAPIPSGPPRYDVALDLTRMNRVLAYDPRDLTLGVEAGISIAFLLDALAEKKQFIPLLVPFLDRATIGGIISANSFSSLRYSYGGPRDFVLGMEFVSGDGKLCKSGGRVVKNVTGYDLHKLLIGALGTLGVITRVNFRTFPLPPAQRTFVISYGTAEEALALVHAIAKSPLEPRLVEVADPRAPQIIASRALPEGKWSVVVAAAGHKRVVERHAQDLARMAEDSCAEGFHALTEEDEQALLGRIREFQRIVAESSPGATLVRINALPTEMSRLVNRIAKIAEQHEVPHAVLVRANRAVFAAFLPAGQGTWQQDRTRFAVKDLMGAVRGEFSGEGAIEFCPTELKREVSVWGAPRGDFALMQKMKRVFDPQGVFSPGRFVGGI